MKKIIAGLLMLAVCGTAMAQIYKWVDEKGVTHYDQRSPQNVKSKEVQLHDGSTGATPPAPSGASPDSAKDKDRGFRQRQAQREKDAAKLAHDTEEREKKCAYMTGRLAELQRSRRVYETNANGERVYLDDQQRDKLQAQHEQEYNQNCK
ncbi:MAG TPA: DUF4124 domain-containing protein [Burkholderiales bacterium]|nr:DUF4124 domain-containing protein [Burkholderiales bacterium]